MKALLFAIAVSICAGVLTWTIDFLVTGNEIIEEPVVLEVIEVLEPVMTEQEIIANFYYQQEQALQRIRNMCPLYQTIRCDVGTNDAKERMRWGVPNTADCKCMQENVI